MIAIVPVRAGVVPLGADDAIAAASGRVLVIGDGVEIATRALQAKVDELWTCEAGEFAPARWAHGLALLLAAEPAVVLAASPDGRDLAPRLAGVLGRPCMAGCTQVREDRVVTTRHDGAASVTTDLDGPFVATLVARAARRHDVASHPLPASREVALAPATVRDATVESVHDAERTELDLADATRIVAGGVGLGGTEAFAVLDALAELLGASLGATRPVTDTGIVAHDRQIGTTGASVDPALYVTFGISGAVQHTAGLGHPDKVISVNLDAACPMMQMADLAVVADAAATTRSLVHLLKERSK